MTRPRRPAAMLVHASLALAAATSSPAWADTVASLLGNFSVNQFTALALHDETIGVHRVVVFGQLPALRELHAADVDGDGVTTPAERDAHAAKLGRSLADGMALTLDGVRVPLRFERATASLPVEQGGFSLRLDLDYTAMLPGDRAAVRRVEFANGNYEGRFGWNEIVVTASPPWRTLDTDARADSPTHGLTEALPALPASGPLQERAIHFAMTAGGLSRNAASPPARTGMPPSATPEAAASAIAPPVTTLQAWTQRLVALIADRDTGWPVTLLALVGACLLGALHAFSPGHGKTVVGAYLIGSRATARHAVFLGATVTLTHSIGVFALGFATLVASSALMPERLVPWLSVVSGALVLGMGLVLLVQRWPRAQAMRARGSHEPPAGRSPPAAKAAPSAADGGGTLRALALRAAPAARGDGYVAARLAGHAMPALAAMHPDGWHSHGGRWHSHLPPANARDAVSWRGLLALGVSGGLVPCPSAMVLLLAAVALNRTAFGLALVLAFSIGLALTLIGVGLAFLYARHRLPAGLAGGRALRWLPVLSAAAICAVGVALCWVAVTAFA
jgi:ABC-type nickel/cobalt efflux system permease component RcnA